MNTVPLWHQVKNQGFDWISLWQDLCQVGTALMTNAGHSSSKYSGWFLKRVFPLISHHFSANKITTEKSIEFGSAPTEMFKYRLCMERRGCVTCHWLTQEASRSVVILRLMRALKSLPLDTWRLWSVDSNNMMWSKFTYALRIASCKSSPCTGCRSIQFSGSSQT